LQESNCLFLVLITAVFIYGCGKEPEKKDYIARVNDSYLTQDELEKMIDSAYKNNFYTNEIIRNWIDQELLFQQAVSEGIVEEPQFRRIMAGSEKSLAAAMFLEKISEQYHFEYTDDDLEKFFNDKKEDFRLIRDTYLLNEAEFNSEIKAIEFRNSVMEGEWQKVIESGKFDSSNSMKTLLLLSEDDIYPISVRNILEELYPRELSIAINIDSSNFKVIQLIEKYPAGTVPPFNVIKSTVEQKFIFNEKRKYIDEYIKNLYSDNDIEVKKQDIR